MEKAKNYRIKLGLFVTTATLVFIIAMYFIGDKQNLFGSTVEVKAIFSHVSGLQKGNNVRYSGINIGTVRNIEIISDTSVLVTLVIQEDALNYIHRDALLSIGTDGLMGDQLINIGPGTPNSGWIKENDTLFTINRFDSDRMIRGLGQAGSNLEEISANLADIMNKINSGEGMIGQMVYDQEMADDLRKTLHNLDQICGRLAYVSVALEESVDSEKGILGILLKDTVLSNDLRIVVQDLKNTSANLNQTTQKIDELVVEVKEGNGLTGAVISDTNMVNSLEESLENIRKGTKAFDENMEALRHNFLFKGYFKKQERKARKNE